MYLITKWFGTFICDKKGIQNKILFPNEEKEIAKRLLKINNKDILTEEKKITKGTKEIIVSEKRLLIIGEYKPSDPFFKKLEIKPEDFDFSEDLLHKATLIVTKRIVDKKLASEDLQIVQMVNALDDLIQTSNLFSERLDSWSAIPTSKEKIKPLQNVFSTVNTEIKSLEKQIDNDMEKIALNISKMTGPLIGARLINKSPRAIRGKIARIFAAKISIAAKADAFTKRDISKKLKEDLENRIREIKNP